MIDMITTTLGEVGKVKMCKHILKEQTSNEGDIPFYKIGTFGGQPDSFINKELFEKYKEKFSYPKIGNTLISASGTIGRTVRYEGEEAYYQDSNIVWIDNDESKVLDDYLYYVYQKIRWVTTTGATITRLYNSNIESMEIKIPKDLNVQKQIVDVLNPIEKKISLNNSICEKLKLIAKTIYDYWFLQFEFPNEEGKPYKSSGGKMVWNEELQRDIPEGWEVGNISSLIDSKKNGDWGKENMQGNYVLPVSCIRGADLDFVNGKSLSTPPTRFILEKNSSKLLKLYDFVIEISGGSPTQSTGRIAGISSYLFSRFNNGIVCSNFCKAITLKDKVSYYYFLQTWTTLFENDVMFNWEGKTSGIKNLMFDSFVKNTKIVIPNKQQLNTFFELCDGIDNKIQNLLKQNQELLSLRDFLLPLLMNGQVTIGE